MTFSIPLFRTQFPEFADTTEYPTQMISFWSALAQQQLPQATWGTIWANGVSLYTAHELTIASQDRKSAAIGGTPGISGGIANTKTVGSVTVGYDSSTTTGKDADWWNRSTYGIQMYRLIKIFGAGAIQL